MTDTSNLPAIPDEFNVGLEDFDESDMVMPTISIDHESGFLVDDLSGVKYNELPCVALGLVKGRVLWPAELSDGGGGDVPLCKSYNFDQGRPDPEKPERFPWAASGFAFVDYQEPNPILNCGDCSLKEWGTHPKGDNPWCTVQYTIPLMLATPAGGFRPALIRAQRTSIKPANTYFTSFRGDNVPSFVCYTQIGLEQRKKGSKTYSVLDFTRLSAVDPENFKLFADTFRRIRGFLQTPRGVEEDEEVPVAAPAPSQPVTVTTPAIEATATTVPPPAAVPEPVVAVVAEQAPVATPAPVAEPVAAPVEAPVPAAAPVPAPTPVAAPDPVPAPEPAPAPPVEAAIAPAPQESVAAVPAAAPVPTPVADGPVAVPVPGGDDFPF